MREIINRLNLDEPSTYNAFAIGLGGIGLNAPEPAIQGGSWLLAGIFTILGWLIPEKK